MVVYVFQQAMMRALMPSLLVLALFACAKRPPVTNAPVAAVPPESQQAPIHEDASGPAQGEPCPDLHCAKGLRCGQYYGVMGPRGPRFSSCEIRCARTTSACPTGQHCTTISDGPGRVCRPDEPR